MNTSAAVKTAVISISVMLIGGVYTTYSLNKCRGNSLQKGCANHRPANNAVKKVEVLKEKKP